MITGFCAGDLHFVCTGIIAQEVPTIPRPRCQCPCHDAKSEKVAA